MAIKGRKGVIYLFMAVIFLILFLTIFLTHDGYKHRDRQELERTRILAIEGFLNDLQQDIHRSAYISGFRTLIAMEVYLSDQGTFFSTQEEMEEAFRESFTTGFINGTHMAIMDNSTFNDYLSRVQAQADIIDIDVNLHVNRIDLEQSDPWTVTITIESALNVSDELRTAWWELEENYSTDIPIWNLKDPLYTINSLGRVPNTIRNYTLPESGYVNESDNNTAVLQDYIAITAYRETPEGPSFLQRFTNNLSASPNGIESIVNLPSFSDQGLVVKTDRSVVDHLYFSTNPDNSTDRCNIQNMIYSPNWFRIDSDHLDDYELDILSSTNC